MLALKMKAVSTEIVEIPAQLIILAEFVHHAKSLIMECNVSVRII
jgi:hypothetical protein